MTKRTNRDDDPVDRRVVTKRMKMTIRDGNGTPRDPAKARKCSLKALANGHDKVLFELAVMVVDKGLTNIEKQIIEDLIESEFIVIFDVCKEWSQWYLNERCKTDGRQGNDITLTSDNLNLADATFLLARLLSSTLDQDNLRIANKLISNVKEQLDTHELLAWLSILVEDLCKENEERSHIKQLTERVFDIQKEVRPLALIGQGQFGKVYLAWYSAMEEFVAIKFVDINLAYEDRVLARNVVREQFTCRVLKEKKVKHTVRYLGYTDLLQYGKRGLIFELCADITKVKEDAEKEIKKMKWDTRIDLEGLPDWTKKVPSSLNSCVGMCEIRKFSATQIITMLRKTAEALLEVHKLGFIHRDIAPRNILCDEKGNVQLADFGWVKFVGSSYDDASLLADYGKACFSSGHGYALAWWAPECFGSEEEDIDAVFSWNSDVYAFGTTMWMCFSHKDPFSHVSDPEQIKKMILEGKRPSLVKKPDAGGVLDRNTPDALIALIDSCWKQKATERMTLAGVIEVLGTLETNLEECVSSHQGKKSYKNEVTQYWYDESTNKILKRQDALNEATQADDNAIYGGDYTEAQNINRLQKICHECPTLDKIPSHVKNSLGEYPYDVFLVHAGEKKMDTVETMKKTFQDGGLRCFLDREMTPGDPAAASMRFALATCRYAVVVLSHECCTKPNPASELIHSFKRMEWIRQQNDLQVWNPLIVVLYNITVQEYKDMLTRVDGIELPASLCSDVVLVEWSDSGRTPWYVECLKLKAEIIKQDKDKNALNKWLQYLKLYVSNKDRPTLASVIRGLRSIETNLLNWSSPKDQSQDDQSIGDEELSDDFMYGGTYAEQVGIETMEKIRHKCKTSDRIPWHVKNSLQDVPYDVFLVHAGEQKMGPVFTMKRILQQGGLRCFLDRDMAPAINPTQSMRFALATCRYAVVVLSRECFTKRHPSSEFRYAFQRMQWIRQQDRSRCWDSLYVVLYNVTVEEYKARWQKYGIELPDSLCSDVVLLKYSDSGNTPWDVNCLELRTRMINQDTKKNALDKWVQYLAAYPCKVPSADALYLLEGNQRNMVEMVDTKTAMATVMFGTMVFVMLRGSCNV